MDAKEIKTYVYILLLVLLIGIIMMYFFISLIRQQRVTLELKKQNLRAELASIEKERARIAEDLHDELSPLVSAIKLKVSSFELADEGDKIQQKKTDEHLGDLARRLREISFNLMPVTLQRKGLVPALHELAGYVSSHHGFRIEVEAADGIIPAEASSVHLYRVVQEIVHNTIKHAGASHLSISLKEEDGNLVVTTRDNGRGFNYPKQLAEGGGLGLRSLLSRTDFLGGELFIDSKQGAGTTYTIEIPISS